MTPWELLRRDDGEGGIALSDGRSFAHKPNLMVLRLTLGGEGGITAMISGREQSATAARAPQVAPLVPSIPPCGFAALYATARAAFLYCVRGWKLPTEVWRTCSVLEGR